MVFLIINSFGVLVYNKCYFLQIFSIPDYIEIIIVLENVILLVKCKCSKLKCIFHILPTLYLGLHFRIENTYDFTYNSLHSCRFKWYIFRIFPFLQLFLSLWSSGLFTIIFLMDISFLLFIEIPILVPKTHYYD